MTLSPLRRNLLAQAHIAKKQLGLDDGTWQALVLRVTGHESCKDATDRQLSALIEALKTQGFKTESGASGRPPFQKARKPQARLVYALWGALGEMGALKDPSKGALRTFCAHQLDLGAATDPDLLTNAQLDPVIHALKAWNQREVRKRTAAESAGRKAK